MVINALELSALDAGIDPYLKHCTDKKMQHKLRRRGNFSEDLSPLTNT